MAVSRKVRAARWGGALLVALTPLPWLGLGSAQAADTVTYATVTGHESFSSDANHPDYWGDNCEKIVDGGNLTSYVLTQDYDLVVVKSASKNVDPYTNTLFADASSGETVWADTNGNGTFDPGGKNGDKAISHIIVCGPGETESPSPSPSTSISTSKSASPSTSISTSKSASPSTSISTSKSASPSTSISTSRSASPSTSLSSSGGASPSSSISTNHSGKPQDSSSPAAITESSGAAALPHTGSDTPVAGAIGISLLLMGLGVLLLLGPGRLMPAGYHRKH
ncbi:MAG: hypothetical protein ACJ74E_08525 [Actinomycetes bacterium]